MSWLDPVNGSSTRFLLGRPGYEVEFEVNPESISIEDQSIAVRQRMLDGSMKKSILNASMPIIKIGSKYLTPSQRNQLASLSMIDDTFLSFQVRDDLQVLALKVVPTTTSSIVLPNLSCLRLSKALVDAGFSSIITINQINELPNPVDANLYDEGGYDEGGYSGTDYVTGGSYNDSTYTLTLGTPLANLLPVYITFTYKGWLVDIEKLPTSSVGSNIDWFSYEFQLTSA